MVDEEPQNRGGLIRSLNIALIVITSIFIIARLHVRAFMTKALGLDDFLAFIAYGLAMAMSVMEIVLVGYGSGTPMGELDAKQTDKFLSTLPINQILFVLACGMVRISILAFLPRLSKDRVFLRLVWAVGVLIVAITLVAFFFLLTECRPISDLFDASKPDRKCISKRKEAYMMRSHSIVGIIIDIALFFLPIWVIHRKMTFGSKVVKVILVFCVGLAAIVIGIIRFGFIITIDFTTNTSYKMSRVGPWTVLEVHVGLWCGCFPALQPFLRLVSYKLGLGSRLDSTSKKSSRTGTNAQSQGRNWPGASGYIKQNSHTEHGSDGASARVIVSGGDSTTEIVEMDDMDKDSKAIRMRTDIQVRIEEGVQIKDVKTTWHAL